MTDNQPFAGQRILVTGGTGSLGKLLVTRLLRGDLGDPEKVIVFSRDEAKQHSMRLKFEHLRASTEEVIFHNFQRKLEFRIGDIRDYDRVVAAIRDVDVIFNAAAMKQVPTCEYFPSECVQTNIIGAENLVRAIEQNRIPVQTVVGISTDKACKPVNVMGMSKALQERIFVQANMRCPNTRFVCVRYGNVLASRGSVVPLFREQIRQGRSVTITTPDMTRFLLSLDDAVNTVFAAVRYGQPGQVLIPRVRSALIVNVAKAMIDARPIEIMFTGIRPGEKLHEILVSEEEVARTVLHADWYAICPMLPELCPNLPVKPALSKQYSSDDDVMDLDETKELLRSNGLLSVDSHPEDADLEPS